jgi:hypothetical protein
VWFSCAIALLLRSVRIPLPHPLHSSELSRTRPGSSPRSSSLYRPRPRARPRPRLVLDLHGGTLPRGTLNGAFLRSPKPRLAATFKDRGRLRSWGTRSIGNERAQAAMIAAT